MAANAAGICRDKCLNRSWLRRKPWRSPLLRPRSLHVPRNATRRVVVRIELCCAHQDQALPIPFHLSVMTPVSAEFLWSSATLRQDLALLWRHHQHQARTRQSITCRYTTKIFEENVNVLEYRQHGAARMIRNVMCVCRNRTSCAN